MSSPRVWYFRLDRATVAGAVATLAGSLLLMNAPGMIDFEFVQSRFFELTGIWMWDDPFPALQWLGGCVGGFVAGYLSPRDVYDAFMNTLQGLVLGLVGFYFVNVGLNANAVFRFAAFDPFLVLGIAIQLLFFMLVPFTFLYLLQGAVAGSIGYLVGNVLVPGLDLGGLSPTAVRVVRGGAGVASFLFVFWLVWWFVFLVEDAFGVY